MRMKDEDWDAVIDTNLKAVFRLLPPRGHKPMMKQRAGRIVNITSVVGASGNPGQANYCAAKAGVAGLTRSLARELGSPASRSTAWPGLHRHRHDRSPARGAEGRVARPDPAGRLGQPGEIAAAVAFWPARPPATSPVLNCTSTAACS